jgi:hypothetical protein
MSAFERWAADRECVLVALATRRAAPFYRALGYEQYAIYHHKILPDHARGIARPQQISACDLSGGVYWECVLRIGAFRWSVCSVS